MVSFPPHRMNGRHFHLLTRHCFLTFQTARPTDIHIYALVCRVWNSSWTSQPLKTKALCCFETSESTNLATRRHMPEDLNPWHSVAFKLPTEYYNGWKLIVSDENIRTSRSNDQHNLGVFLCRCLCSEIARSGEEWDCVVEGAHRLTGVAKRVPPPPPVPIVLYNVDWWMSGHSRAFSELTVRWMTCRCFYLLLKSYRT
jgi:hypothetical protein